MPPVGTSASGNSGTDLTGLPLTTTCISPTGVVEEGTDFGALSEGYVSITPLQLDLTYYKAMDVMKKWKWK